MNPLSDGLGPFWLTSRGYLIGFHAGAVLSTRNRGGGMTATAPTWISALSHFETR
ncbi:hypothetical protein UC8_41130 [Roseimaritima ulvae]|uniref:Uncharacterized protein n=1 Tax=Roseimaritima ulvae TaxID=980254 RepID=A0A5B9R6V5_9BACT|nr:hypothetical protein UC8_41130 [Roseimaritima ulvae]